MSPHLLQLQVNNCINLNFFYVQITKLVRETKEVRRVEFTNGVFFKASRYTHIYIKKKWSICQCKLFLSQNLRIIWEHS